METQTLKSTQMNVNEVDNKDYLNNEELVERHMIDDAPFSVITQNGESFGVMGQYKITEKGKKEDIIKELENITWNRIVQVIMILGEINKKQELNLKTNNKTNKK